MRKIISKLGSFDVDVPALRPGTIGGYLLAFVSVGVATALRLAIAPYVEGLQFATYLPAVIITTLISGSGAGLLSVALSCASIAIFVLPPRFSLYIEKPGDVLALFLYTAVMLFTVVLMRLADQRRLDREALQESKDRLQSTLDAARLGSWRYNHRHRFCSWDARSKEIFGVPEDGATIEEFMNWVHPDDEEKVWAAYHRALDPAQPERSQTQFRLRRENGKVRWVETQGLVHLESAGRERQFASFIGTVQDITERKSAEEAQARLAAIVTSSADAIVGKTLDGIVTSWNQAAERMFGYSASEMIGQSIRRLIPADRQPEEDMILGRLAHGERVELRETVRIAKDGRTVDVSIAVSPMRDAEGRIIGAAKIARDITARKQADELLRRQADLLEQSHDAIFTWKIGSGGIAYWNRGAEALYGYTREEAIGSISHELLRTRSSGSNQEREAQIAREGGWYGELIHTTRGGYEIAVESRHVRFVTYDGEIYVLETNRDITDRKRAEDALRNSEERLRAIYDGTYQYIGLLSPDGTLLEANRASLEFAGDAFGSRREHVVGRPFWETVWFIHTPGAPEKLREAIARAAAGEFIRYEAPLMRPSGEEVIFDFSLHPVRNTQGDVFLIVPEGRIITDRKRAEEELAESEERMRFIADRAQIGYWDWQIATDRVEWSLITNQLLGIPPEDQMSYARFLAAVHPDDRERTDRATRACLESGGKEGYDVEFRTLWPDESVRWIRGKGNATFEDGKPVRMAGLAFDITERKQQEEREHLLVREMNHRVKNILTVVDAIAHRTAAENPEDFAKRFSERIGALSANQDLLFRNEWRGVDVEELVRAQLSHFADLIGSRIVLDGPKLRFNTAGAQAVGLALHELATNASKFGALSTDKGRVDLSWNFSDNALTMSWTEREGPSVSAPKRRGFGTTVIERMAKSSLGGTVDLDYAPSGLTWCLTCPAGNALERRNGDRFSSGS
jgi:PAS domain S-box-containing protein